MEITGINVRSVEEVADVLWALDTIADEVANSEQGRAELLMVDNPTASKKISEEDRAIVEEEYSKDIAGLQQRFDYVTGKVKENVSTGVLRAATEQYLTSVEEDSPESRERRMGRMIVFGRVLQGAYRKSKDDSPEAIQPVQLPGREEQPDNLPVDRIDRDAEFRVSLMEVPDVQPPEFFIPRIGRLVKYEPGEKPGSVWISLTDARAVEVPHARGEKTVSRWRVAEHTYDEETKMHTANGISFPSGSDTYRLVEKGGTQYLEVYIPEGRSSVTEAAVNVISTDIEKAKKTVAGRVAVAATRADQQNIIETFEHPDGVNPVPVSVAKNN